MKQDLAGPLTKGEGEGTYLDNLRPRTDDGEDFHRSVKCLKSILEENEAKAIHPLRKSVDKLIETQTELPWIVASAVKSQLESERLARGASL